MNNTNQPIYSRRLFLTRGVQLLSVASTLPLFLDRSGRAMAAEFAANPQGAGRPDNVLVIVQLAGGNDGLNTLIPITNDHYYKARPRLGVGKNKALKISDEFAFHPSAPGFKKLYEAGHMAVVHAVGYPNHNRSHFRSTDIWQTAEPDKVGHSGWLGRYFDACCSGSDPGPKEKAAEPSAAIALTNEPPQALHGKSFLPIAFRSLDMLSYREGNRNAAVKDAFNKLNDIGHEEMMDDDHPSMNPKKISIPLGTNGSLVQPKDETDEFLQRTALNARVYAEQIRKSAATVANKARYPQNGLANDMKLVAQMIASGLPTRVYYVTIGGFDTHSNQEARHTRLMEELSSALAAFVDDLQALGHLDRTTVMTFSEFGRRVSENSSGGTDHGEAAPLFVLGGKVQPGFYGNFPDLAPAKLHRGDVPFATDFRRVYATMLRQWLKTDDAKILEGKFEPLKLLKTV